MGDNKVTKDMLLIIKELGEELLRLAEPGYDKVILELLSLIDSYSFEPSLETRMILESLKMNRSLRMRVAEELYPVIKDLIDGATYEYLARSRSSQERDRASKSPS